MRNAKMEKGIARDLTLGTGERGGLDGESVKKRK